MERAARGTIGSAARKEAPCARQDGTHGTRPRPASHASGLGLLRPQLGSLALQGIGFVAFDDEDQATAALDGLQASRESASSRSCIGAVFS
jgi:hypothetical protein